MIPVMTGGWKLLVEAGMISVAAAWVLAGAVLWRGERRIRFLRAAAPLPAQSPAVSIIVPARNEERNLEEALRLLLAIDYAPLEIIAIDDRSTDRTGEILARIAAADPRLRVRTVRELPPGWLGKNYAQWLGARQARGEILLFTDADVLMEPSVLKRAVAYLESEKLDHLCAAPRVTSGGWVMQSLMGCFMLVFSLYARPWNARNPKSALFMGVGSFNLMTRRAYDAIGTHEAFAMNPIDDMMLGKLVKQKGLRQEFCWGAGLLAIDWYPSFGAMLRGLEKNAFAGAHYRVDWVLAGSVAAGVLGLLPLIGLWMGTGWLIRLSFGSVFGPIVLTGWHNRRQGYPVMGGLLLPFSFIVGIGIVWRSMVLALWRGGIDWRGTRYPLSEVRRHHL